MEINFQTPTPPRSLRPIPLACLRADDAFGVLLKDLKLTKKELLANKDLLTAVLSYHVLGAKVMKKDLKDVQVGAGRSTDARGSNSGGNGGVAARGLRPGTPRKQHWLGRPLFVLPPVRLIFPAPSSFCCRWCRPCWLARLAS